MPSSSSRYPVGFHPVPRDPEELNFPSTFPASTSLSVDGLPLPSSSLVTSAKAYLKQELTDPIWNHSHRTYLIGAAFARLYFEDKEFDPESFYLACMFHDLGCTDANIKRTRMSFEFFGGLLCHQWLLEHGAERDLADSVAEAVFRHTDFNKGSISLNGQLIQIGTLFDNIHAHAHLLPPALVDEIIAAYPRGESWGGCFKSAMQAEFDAKPWAHVSELRGTGKEAWDKILDNGLEKAGAA